MKTSRPVIAVDIDEVLLPLHEHFLYHHNEQYGTKFVYPDPEGRYLLQEFTGEEVPVLLQKLRTYYESGETKHLQPLPGAVAAIKQLRKRYDLVIISNQQLFQGKYSQIAIKKHFGNAFKDIYFTALPAPGHDPLSKSEICKKVGATYLVDDTIKNAVHCAAEGIEVILFGDYHWNKQEDLPAGITRCRDWQEVLEYFDGKS